MIRTFLITLFTVAAFSTTASASLIDWDKDHDNHRDNDHNQHSYDKYDKDDHNKLSYNDHDRDDYTYSGDWDDHGKKDHDDRDGNHDYDKGHDHDHDYKWKVAECNVGKHDHDHDHDWDFDHGHDGKHCHPGGGVSSVPLPPSLMMFGAALAALGAIAWRRRKAKA